MNYMRKEYRVKIKERKERDIIIIKDKEFCRILYIIV